MLRSHDSLPNFAPVGCIFAMRDTLDPSLTFFGLFGRVLAVCAAIVIVPALVAVTGESIHDYRHPAPLGRTTEAMLERVDKALPPGTALDSASRYLRSLGLSEELYTAADASRRLRGDTLLAGGPVILAVHADTAGWFGGWVGSLTLYFSPEGRLARRDARVSVLDPF